MCIEGIGGEVERSVISSEEWAVFEEPHFCLTVFAVGVVFRTVSRFCFLSRCNRTESVNEAVKG